LRIVVVVLMYVRKGRRELVGESPHYVDGGDGTLAARSLTSLNARSAASAPSMLFALFKRVIAESSTLILC
jgi:hypothetical protein